MTKHMHWVLIALVAVLGLSVWSYLTKGVNLGLDLRGGSVLTYRIPTTGMSPDEAHNTLKNTVKVFRQRLDATGLGEISIEQAGASSVRISMPGREQSEVGNIKTLLQKLGQLQFRIVAEDGDPTEFGRLDLAKEREIFLEDPDHYQPPKSNDPDYPGFQWFQWRDKEDEGKPKWDLVRIDRWNFTGKDLRSLSTSLHPQTSLHWIVNFGIADLRQNDFGSFTGPNSDDVRGEQNGRRMGIILDGKIDSAPSLRSKLTTGGFIEGDFTQQQAEQLVNVLLSGSLEVKPELESEYSVGPSLGEDAVRKGITAIIIGFALVVLVMIYYYLFQGIIANLVLLLNLVILVGILSFLGAALTLPGMAGIVLTVGMAVDSNILIYERIREEKAKGKTLLQAVKNGYDRAFVTIVDANLTTIITALILYFVGTGPVQGFAVTLIIGIVASMFTAVAVSRLIVEVLMSAGLVTEIRFTKLLLGERHVRYMKIRPLMIGISLVLIVGGALLYSSRGDEKYDIDFTGGAEVHLRFRQPTEIADVRRAVTSRYPDATVVTVKSERADQEDLNLDRTSDWFTVKAKVHTDAEKAEFEQFLRESFAGRLMPAGAVVRDVGSEDGDYEREHVGGQCLTLSFQDAIDADGVRGLVREAGEDADGADVVPAGSWREDDPTGTARTWKVYYRTRKDGPVQAVDAITRVAEQQGRNLTDPIPATTFIGSIEAGTIRNQAVEAVLLSLIAQILYIAFRFKGFSFGFAAVIADAHDVLVTLGVVAFVDMTGIVDVKINLPIIAAFLTLIGYSMNDTIVVFDRIRENRQRWKGAFSDLIDGSVNQTLSRTIRTALTTFIVLLVIFIVNRGAASVLEGFSFVMLAGVIVGTYSSIFIASPMLMFLPWYWRKVRNALSSPLAKSVAFLLTAGLGVALQITGFGWAWAIPALIVVPFLIAVVYWLFIPDADRALNLALRASEGGAA